METTDTTNSTVIKNILDMTHEELMKASEETRKAYFEAKLSQKYSDALRIIEIGAKHIYLDYGSILVRKNKNGVFYALRNGKGTGCDVQQFTDLLDAVKSADSSGWGRINSFK